MGIAEGCVQKSPALSGTFRVSPGGDVGGADVETIAVDDVAAFPGAYDPKGGTCPVGSTGTAPFIVGCGYAGHHFVDTTGDSGIQEGTRIVRLADGRSWKLLTVDARAWVTPVAITCSELFVNTFAVGSGAGDGGALAGPNLARVRLDSLGPGDPPD